MSKLLTLILIFKEIRNSFELAINTVQVAVDDSVAHPQFKGVYKPPAYDTGGEYPIINAYEALSRASESNLTYPEEIDDYSENDHIPRSKITPKKKPKTTRLRQEETPKPTNYCDIPCGSKGRTSNQSHILCQNPDGNCIASKCRTLPYQINDNNLTQVEIKTIVDIHNRYRSYLATGKHFKLALAPKMKELVWNEELAKVAQCWAGQCKTAPDPCPHLSSMRVRSNFGQIESNNNNVVSIIVNNWFTGLEILNRESKVESGYVKDLQKMLSPMVEFIGCGVMEQKLNYYLPIVRLYCNYGPAPSMRKLSRVLKPENTKLRKRNVGCSVGYEKNQIGLCAKVRKVEKEQQQVGKKRLIPWFRWI